MTDNHSCQTSTQPMMHTEQLIEAGHFTIGARPDRQTITNNKPASHPTNHTTKTVSPVPAAAAHSRQLRQATYM
jgi:hypothetical protein